MTTATQLPTAFAEPLPFPVRRFTVDEYHRLGDAGVLTEEDEVELLEGLITPKMIRKPVHDAIVSVVSKQLSRLLPEGWHLRIQMAVTTADSEPEPDLAVVRGGERDYLSRHPSPEDIALLVEVSETSLQRDRNKARLYARAAVAEYWIANLVDNCIEHYSEPRSDASDARYSSHRVYRGQEMVPVVIDGSLVGHIAAAELLP